VRLSTTSLANQHDRTVLHGGDGPEGIALVGRRVGDCQDPISVAANVILQRVLGTGHLRREELGVELQSEHTLLPSRCTDRTRLLVQAGPRHLALRHYQALRATVQREWDVEPPASLQALYQDLRGGHPA
jgi:hypothetical protein